MKTLGLSAYYHDASAALMVDGEVVAAAQEERFNRDKYSPVFPIQAINSCLQQAGLTVYDLDEIAFYEKMYLKFERTMLSHIAGFPFTFKNFLDTMPLWLKDRLAVSFTVEEELAWKKPVLYVKHHLSHAASAFFLSPFERAAILTVDGVGEEASATWGTGAGDRIEIRREQRYPHSLGLLYSIVTAYLGFRVFTGEGKVMALAEYGEPRFLDTFRQIVSVREDGSFALDLRCFSFNRGDRMHNARFEALFGPARAPGAPLEDRHQDVAASLQRLTEEILLKMARHVRAETGETRLCLAGGVALNVTANSRIREEAGFEDLFIQPAAGDAGAALGAAAFVQHAVQGAPRRGMQSAALGPRFTDRAVEVLLRNRGLRFRRRTPAELVQEVAARLAKGEVFGWFQGRMEFGPRALGQRSMLASPCLAGHRDRLNLEIKRREAFRPFGASVLAERVSDWFEFQGESPYMLLVAPIRPEKRVLIPAVAHVNGTSRIQTVSAEQDGLYHALITAFEAQTGVPMLLNTSFNRDEPIVHTPQEAIQCFLDTGLDGLVMHEFLVERA